jgi:hypothetical protein
MKTMIHTLAYTALLSIALSSCNDDNAPILAQKDWNNTAARRCIESEHDTDYKSIQWQRIPTIRHQNEIR